LDGIIEDKSGSHMDYKALYPRRWQHSNLTCHVELHLYMLRTRKELSILTSLIKASINIGATRIFQGDAVNTMILSKEQLESLLSFTFKLFENIFMKCINCTEDHWYKCFVHFSS
jgi:hypothetical protein